MCIRDSLWSVYRINTSGGAARYGRIGVSSCLCGAMIVPSRPPRDRRRPPPPSEGTHGLGPRVPIYATYGFEGAVCRPNLAGGAAEWGKIVMPIPSAPYVRQIQKIRCLYKRNTGAKYEIFACSHPTCLALGHAPRGFALRLRWAGRRRCRRVSQIYRPAASAVRDRNPSAVQPFQHHLCL